MRRAFGAVALIALACLLLRAARVGLAGDYVDPIGKVTAQDEALYAHSAIHMATAGDWLTPRFLGRYALYKPPMLAWLSGLSARAAGISSLALRFPVALLCALSAGLIFLWAAEERSWQAGAAALLLLAGNHLWHVLGGMCMTDGLLAAFYIAAMYCLYSDPWLESRPALWGFAAAVAAGILTKSVAGVLPLAVLGGYRLVARKNERPSWRRMALAGALAAALAAPWFLYQMAVHGRWFFAEHIGVEILGFGAGAPPQTSRENQVWFYLSRLGLLDPVLLGLTVVALPNFWRSLRRRSSGAVLLLCWMAVPLGAALVWQYRNVSYLLPVFPAMAIVAGTCSPYASGRQGKALVALAAAAFCMKGLLPDAPWGIAFRKTTIQAAAPALTEYCARGRGNELVVVGLVDDLYASVLPLAKLRYLMTGAAPADAKYGMPFAEMGITISNEQFNDLARWTPGFRDKLRQWGLDSGEPIGSLILVKEPADLAGVVAAHPETDFFLADRWRQPVGPQPHHEEVAAPGYFFLLARQPRPRSSPPAWGCAL